MSVFLGFCLKAARFGRQRTVGFAAIAAVFGPRCINQTFQSFRGHRLASHLSGSEKDVAAATSQGGARNDLGISGAAQEAHQDQWDIEVVDPFKAQGTKLVVQLVRIEVAEERLANRGDTGCPLLILRAVDWIDPVARLAVVKHYLRSTGMGGKPIL
jgi:hypothetical protein